MAVNLWFPVVAYIVVDVVVDSAFVCVDVSGIDCRHSKVQSCVDPQNRLAESWDVPGFDGKGYHYTLVEQKSYVDLDKLLVVKIYLRNQWVGSSDGLNSVDYCHWLIESALRGYDEYLNYCLVGWAEAYFDVGLWFLSVPGPELSSVVVQHGFAMNNHFGHHEDTS